MSGGERPAISMPLSRMRPESGFNAPVTRLKNVLLPAPLGPITAVSDPSAKFNVISSAALTPPNVRFQRDPQGGAARHWLKATTRRVHRDRSRSSGLE